MQGSLFVLLLGSPDEEGDGVYVSLINIVDLSLRDK